MIGSWSKRQPGQPWWRIAWWYLMHLICYTWFALAYRYRAWGQKGLPDQGPLLLVSNHQSYLDPIVVGLACHRRQFYALARATLFRHPVFSWIIRSLNAIAVDQEAGDIKAMRLCLDVLSKGHALLLFPEGTRTLDGLTHAFESGVMLLIKRSGAAVVPVAIEGPFKVWPMGRKRPRLTGRIGAMFGTPIPAAQLTAMKPADALEHLQKSVEQLRLELVRKMGV